MRDRAERLCAEAWRWHELADEDLEAADAAVYTDLAPRIACFWAQQAAELAIKAVLVAEDVDPPKSHDLALLAEACRAKEIRGLDRDGLNTLTPWAITARYPMAVADFGSPDLDRLIEIARGVLRVAEAALRRLVGPMPHEET